MESNDKGVELTTEPAIETRFGFTKEKQPLSGRAIKISAICTAAAVTAAMLISSPENSAIDASPGISSPGTSEISQSERVKLDAYSPVKEEKKLKNNSTKRGTHVAVRLPGIEKINRNSSLNIPPGSLVKAVLLTGASDGSAKVEVKEPLRDHGETLVPAGAVLWGKAKSGEDRLFIQFTKMRLKDGEVQDVNADAADFNDQTIGLKGSRVGRYALKYATAVGLNFVGGMAEGLQQREIVGTQVITKPDAKNALLNGASRATLEMGNQEMQKIRSQPTVIQVPAGTEIYVMFGASD